jgi:hypothetical protein
MADLRDGKETPSAPRTIARTTEWLSPNYVHVCENVCSHWAVKDIDCPKGGCLGFKFTIPGGFKAAGQFERPKPTEYPADPLNG